MTHFDDFDDEDTVLHLPAVAPSAEADPFDDDDTFLEAFPQPGPVAGTPSEPSPSTFPGPAAATATHPVVEPPAEGVARSLDALQREAPIAPAWRPPDRPTSYEAVPWDGAGGSRRRWLKVASVLAIAALACGAAAVATWLLLTEPAGSDDESSSAVSQDHATLVVRDHLAS